MPVKSAHKKTSGWKDKQSRTLSYKRTKLAVIVLLLTAGIIFASWAVNFTKSLFVPNALSVRSYRWDGEFNINLAVRGSAGIWVFSYNPKEEEITLLTIPDETFTEVPGGHGRWQMRAVYGLGGNQLLKETLTSFLAIPIDGFLDLTDTPYPSADKFIEKLRENPLSGISMLSLLKTDLSLWELIKLKMAILGVRFDKIAGIDPLERKVLDKEKLPDGTEVYTADPVRIDSVLAAFQDPAVLAEHKSIAVFNAAETPLLAQYGARLINNLGGNVIITSNAKVKNSKTVVYGEKSQTIKRLRQIFELDCQIKPKCDMISAPEEDLATSRAEINIFLGENYSR